MSRTTKNTARSDLLDQLAYLAEEVAALRSMLDHVPAEILEGRPLESSLSIKEMYALIMLRDRYVFIPALKHTDGHPDVEIPPDESLLDDGSWHECEMKDVLQALIDERERLVRTLQDLSESEWERAMRVDGREMDVYALAYSIVQHDTTLLRSAADRLHASRLFARGARLTGV